MNKADIVDKISAEADITKSQAETAFSSIIETISNALKTEGKVTLVGFGSFAVTERAARTGRNPQTGAALDIPAASAVKFTPGKELKASVKG